MRIKSTLLSVAAVLLLLCVGLYSLHPVDDSFAQGRPDPGGTTGGGPNSHTPSIIQIDSIFDTFGTDTALTSLRSGKLIATRDGTLSNLFVTFGVDNFGTSTSNHTWFGDASIEINDVPTALGVIVPNFGTNTSHYNNVISNTANKAQVIQGDIIRMRYRTNPTANVYESSANLMTAILEYQ